MPSTESSAGNAPLIEPFRSNLVSITAGLRKHYLDTVLPVWRAVGFNGSLALPYESIGTSPSGLTVHTAERYRAMACARQIFIHAENGDEVHAESLFDALCRRFQDKRHGGFFYSINVNGEPLDRSKDLYTHAFILFACAALVKHFNLHAANEVMAEVANVIAKNFSIDQATTLPNAVVSENFTTIHTASRQNPLMHLSEAYLLARQVSDNRQYDVALEALTQGIAAYFVDEKSGCIMELPANESASWIEPGHQFEWLYLSRGSENQAFERSGLSTHLLRAFEFAQRHGVDPKSGGVAATLDREGNILDGTQRIWAQTEYLRALAYHPDAYRQTQLQNEIPKFQSRFLHSQGWHECLSPNGDVTRNDMPSTTPYHLESSYAALEARSALRGAP